MTMPELAAVQTHLTHVHTPIQIAGVTVPNRIVRAAHSTRIGGGLMTDDLIAFHELRARGGVGLTILEIMGVHPSSPSRLNAYEPSQPARFGKLMEAVRPHGMKLFQQLWHGGHNGEAADGGPPWSSSDIPSPSVGVVPVAMTKGMIDEVVEAFVAAALNLQSWGIEGVELHAGHGYLFSQFLTSYLNDRTDDYGGTLENRARFLLDTAQAVRSAVRPGFAVGVRLAPDHTVGGIDVETCVGVAHMLEERGLIDFVDISVGNKHTYYKMIGGMHEPTGYEMGESEQIARAVRSVTMVTGRFRTIDDADQAIRQGSTDMVAMVRATIADPFIVKKSFEGRAEQVRPCIGCNQGCIGQVLAPPFRMGCTVNPSTGFELHFGDHLLQAADVSRNVVVVGGGPAGMEAARVAAIRGHRVTLFEAQPRLGGTIRLAAQAPTRAGIADVTHWLEREVYRLGVDVRLSTYVDADDVLGEAPDVVIVATGSMPRMDGIQVTNPGEPIRGMDQPHVLSSHDVFESGFRVSGRTAVVIDDVGHYEGIAVAEQLASRGLSVTYAARTISFAPRMDPALMTEPALQRLSRADVEVLVRTRALVIEHNAVILAPTYLTSDTNRTRRVPADVVVFVSNNRPLRDLYDALASKVGVILVGDAQAPRFLPTAMREGHLAGAQVQ